MPARGARSVWKKTERQDHNNSCRFSLLQVRCKRLKDFQAAFRNIYESELRGAVLSVQCQRGYLGLEV
jgi:hypothetical protein